MRSKCPDLKSPNIKSLNLKSPNIKSPNIKSPNLKSPNLKWQIFFVSEPLTLLINLKCRGSPVKDLSDNDFCYITNEGGKNETLC